MMPWAHLAIGYLVYSLGMRLWHRRPPSGEATLVLVLGTQLPDMIDKPVSWWLNIYDGRAIGHSLLVMIPLCLVIYAVLRRRDRGGWGVALSVGVITHILGDAWLALLAWKPKAGAGYLLWPVWPAPPYPAEGPGDHFERWLATVRSINYESLDAFLHTFLSLPVAFSLVFFGLWAIDGFPAARTSKRIFDAVRYRYTPF